MNKQTTEESLEQLLLRKDEIRHRMAVLRNQKLKRGFIGLFIGIKMWFKGVVQYLYSLL